MNKFFLFSKKSCGPCALVDKYFKGVKDDRINQIIKVDLEDAGSDPIPEENLRLAKFYSVSATPFLLITDEDGHPIESKCGGMAITQNIRYLLERYASKKETSDQATA